MNQKTQTLDLLETSFEEFRDLDTAPIMTRFLESVKEVISPLQSKFPITIEDRVKKAEKALEKGEKMRIKNLFELNDLFGIRLIVKTSWQVEELRSILRNDDNAKKFKLSDKRSHSDDYKGDHVIIKDDADYKCEIQLRTIIYDSVAKLIHPSYKEGNLTDKDKELLEAARIKQSEIDSKDYNIKDINSNETIAPPILSPKEHAYYISLLNPLPLPEAQAAQLVVTVMIELPPELVSLVERHSPT